MAGQFFHLPQGRWAGLFFFYRYLWLCRCDQGRKGPGQSDPVPSHSFRPMRPADSMNRHLSILAPCTMSACHGCKVFGRLTPYHLSGCINRGEEWAHPARCWCELCPAVGCETVPSAGVKVSACAGYGPGHPASWVPSRTSPLIPLRLWRVALNSGSPVISKDRAPFMAMHGHDRDQF